jgi:hypothetical protein
MINETPARLAPLARTALGALLVGSIAITSLYFIRSRMPSSSVATSVVHPKVPASLAEVAGALPSKALPDAARTREASLPLPDLYGVYAVSAGQLVELEALPGQVPDPRVAMSGVISQPSRVTLPDGRVAFIVFRRDVATSISERVPIRVVAKVKRELEFGPAGEPRGTRRGDSWTIRNVSFDIHVAPIERNRDMVLLRPKSADFTLSPGRYALLLKGQAYDFAVAGPITDPAQCLERVEAANGSFFHECQQPEAGAAHLRPKERSAGARSTPLRSTQVSPGKASAGAE